MPLIGGAAALTRVRRWGGLKSAIGKAVFLIGLGIFSWGCGSMIWSYYNFFLGVSVPYPSWADIGFVPSIFFYGLGAIYLVRATGAKITWKNKYAKIFAVAAPVVIFLLSYYVLVIIARGGVLISSDGTPVKIFLDIIYPLGDFISLTLAILLSGFAFQYLKSGHRFDIMAVLMGLAVMFIVDSIFSYTTTMNTYYNGGPVDFLFIIGQFLLTFGVLGFYTPREARETSSQVSVYGNRAVFISGADDFALVVENEELAKALKKAFDLSVQKTKLPGIVNPILLLEG